MRSSLSSLSSGLTAAALALGACAPAAVAPGGPPSTLSAPEGYTLLFPGPVDTRTGRDGRASFRIDLARTAEGARFEAAWFGFPEALSEDEQQALLARVEQGLTGLPREPGDGRSVGAPSPSDGRLVSRGTSVVSGRASLDLVVDSPDGRRGVHHVLYPSAKAMLQVSATGPRGGVWEREEPAFWASLTLPSGGGE